MREKCPFSGFFWSVLHSFLRLAVWLICLKSLPYLQITYLGKTAHINNKEVLITFYEGKGGPNSIIDIYE